MEEARLAAAVALGNLDAHDTEIEQLVDERPADLRVLVHFAHVWTDFPTGEFVDTVAKQAFVFGQNGQRVLGHFSVLRRHALGYYHSLPGHRATAAPRIPGREGPDFSSATASIKVVELPQRTLYGI